MTHQMSAARTFMGGRGFSSSAIYGLGRPRSYAASVRPLVRNGYGLPGFSSLSSSNLGGSRRISYGGSGAGYYGGHGYAQGGYGSLGFRGGVSQFGPGMHGSVGGQGPVGGHANFRGDGIRGVQTNEKLLKPLRVGVDPQEHEVRTHEKEEMKDLNNQFACFIDKVRTLEQENKVLETKWNLLQQHVIPARKNLEPFYENFISRMKNDLECLLGEKEHLENKNAATQHVVEEFKSKYEEEFKRRTTAENEFVLLKKDVDSVSMIVSTLNWNIGMLSEELNFLQNIYKEELRSLDSQLYNTNILLKMDNSRDLDIDHIIKNVDAWYQSIAHRSKEEVNAFYENRFQELQEQRGKYSNDLKINQNEIAELTRMVHKMQCDHDNIKKQVDVLETSICNVEQRGDNALKDARNKHIELQGALQKAKDDLAGMVRDYHELLNTKMGLDIEIATYKTLLEGEEYRIFTGNVVGIDMAQKPCMGDYAAFPASCGYRPPAGGYGGICGGSFNDRRSGGYDVGGRGRYSGRNYSSRSAGEHSGPVHSSNGAGGGASADAEFHPGSACGARNTSTSAANGNISAGIDGSSRGGGLGIGFGSTPGHGSGRTFGRGYISGNIAGSCPDVGYLSGGYRPTGVIPLGGSLGPRNVGGPVVVGCNPGVTGGVHMGNVGTPLVGIPDVGVPAVGFGGEPCIGVGAPTGVCYPGPVGPPVGVCYPGPVGPPVGACYPGPVGAPVGVCYPGVVGPIGNETM